LYYQPLVTKKMTKFYKLKVKDLIKETDDCMSIAFDVPETLAKDFSYKQGQYLTLRQTINGEEVRRSYSACSSPLDGELRVAVKKIDGGKFSTFANDVLQVGDELEVMPPMGNFYTEVAENQTKNYVAFAAGSGITPILSILKTVLKSEKDSTFTLFYLNRNVGKIIFKEEIEGLRNQYMQRFQVFHNLTKAKLDVPLFFGRYDTEKLQTIFSKLVNPTEVDEFFLCGPEEMIFLVRDELLGRNIDSKKIHFELFTSPDAQKGKEHKAVKAAKSTKASSFVSVKEDGKTILFDLPFNTDNILDAALNNGADLPYACKGGVCCTCKAKLIEGEVDMLVNYALEPEEVAAGFILTCQSYPLTEKVVVDFDQAM
jgi:ring-1,2-phenylacetyl-CoA epoxidase subunit PaaE